MFDFFRKKKISELYSPVIGKSIRLDEVKDKVFASKMMGDGLAFKLDENIVYAPCDAKVKLIPNTKHAIGLEANGLDILIHIGLDTVNLNGEGFKQLVSVGDAIKQGDPLLKIDMEFMKQKNIDLTSPMIITSKEHNLSIVEPSNVNLDSVVIKLE